MPALGLVPRGRRIKLSANSEPLESWSLGGKPRMTTQEPLEEHRTRSARRNSAPAVLAECIRDQFRLFWKCVTQCKGNGLVVAGSIATPCIENAGDEGDEF